MQNKNNVNTKKSRPVPPAIKEPVRGGVRKGSTKPISKTPTSTLGKLTGKAIGNNPRPLQIFGKIADGVKWYGKTELLPYNLYNKAQDAVIKELKDWYNTTKQTFNDPAWFTIEGKLPHVDVAMPLTLRSNNMTLNGGATQYGAFVDRTLIVDHQDDFDWPLGGYDNPWDRVIDQAYRAMASTQDEPLPFAVGTFRLYVILLMKYYMTFIVGKRTIHFMENMPSYMPAFRQAAKLTNAAYEDAAFDTTIRNIKTVGDILSKTGCLPSHLQSYMKWRYSHMFKTSNEEQSAVSTYGTFYINTSEMTTMLDAEHQVMSQYLRRIWPKIDINITPKLIYDVKEVNLRRNLVTTRYDEDKIVVDFIDSADDSAAIMAGTLSMQTSTSLPPIKVGIINEIYMSVNSILKYKVSGYHVYLWDVATAATKARNWEILAQMSRLIQAGYGRTQCKILNEQSEDGQMFMGVDSNTQAIISDKHLLEIQSAAVEALFYTPKYKQIVDKRRYTLVRQQLTQKGGKFIGTKDELVKTTEEIVHATEDGRITKTEWIRICLSIISTIIGITLIFLVETPKI